MGPLMVLSTHSPRYDRMSRAAFFDDKGWIRSMNSAHRRMGCFCTLLSQLARLDFACAEHGCLASIAAANSRQ